MKKILLGAAALFSLTAMSQLSMEILPYTNQNLVITNSVQTKTVEALDIEHEVRMALEESDRDRAGRIVNVNFSLENSGTWTDLDNGDRIWQLRIEAPNAMGVNLYFDEYELPENATLHVFNSDMSKFIGAFTSKNNKAHKRFACDVQLGNSVVLEYYEPAEVAGQGKLSIDGVNRMFVMEDDERADACQVNVNCSEGDGWSDQRDAVVRLLTKTGTKTGYCTGALVNNTNEDCKNYILTALHCGVDIQGQGISQPSNSDLDDYIVRWKYQTATCNGVWAQNSPSLTGVDMVAHSNDGGGSSGSDYFLFEMEDDIPDSHDPYYAGWEASTSPSQSGVSIHHPAGSIKKISTYTQALTSTSWGWGASGSHWRVYWSGTANGHGVTEGGSSGSPIFNANKRIVGQLTGGGSYCNEVQPGGQNQPDSYGKMSYNWSSNNAGDDLKDYLAPGTNITSMAGARRPCVTGLLENGSYEPDVSIYPNPVNDYLYIDLKQFEGVALSMTNELGQVVFQKNLVSSIDVFDVSNLNEGVYFITFIKDGKKAVKKFVKTK